MLGKKVSIRKSTAIGVALALAVSALTVFAAGKFRPSPPPSAPPSTGMRVSEDRVELGEGAPQWNSIKLGKAELATEHWTESVAARVRIDEARAARVGSPLVGRVTAVSVELGQRVKKGDPLFSVASTDLASLRNDAAKASVDVDVAKAQYARVHDMVEARLLPGKDELQAAAEKKQAEIQLHTAQSKISSLKVASSKDNEFIVKAPRDGVIVEKNVLPSQQVTSDSTLIQIAEVSDVWVVADLFENEADGIKEGTPVRITLPSVPGFSVETKVESIAAVVDPARHSIPVRVRVDNPDGKLKPNVYADMRFKVEQQAASVEIDASALVSDGATQSVYVEEAPGKFVKRKIVPGPVRDGKVAILEGLKPGEIVVTQGGILLDNQIGLAH